MPPNVTAFLCQCNLLILKSKCRTGCAILRTALSVTDMDLLGWVASFCARACFFFRRRGQFFSVVLLFPA